MEVLLHDFADAGDFPHFEWGKKARFHAGQNAQDAVGLGLIGGDLGDQPRSGDADRAVQQRLRLDGLVQRVGGAKGGAVQALGAGHIEIGFVDRSHLDERREAAQDFEDAPGVLAITLGMPFDEDGVRAELVRGAQGQAEWTPNFRAS